MTSELFDFKIFLSDLFAVILLWGLLSNYCCNFYFLPYVYVEKDDPGVYIPV